MQCPSDSTSSKGMRHDLHALSLICASCHVYSQLFWAYPCVFAGATSIVDCKCPAGSWLNIGDAQCVSCGLGSSSEGACACGWSSCITVPSLMTFLWTVRACTSRLPCKQVMTCYVNDTVLSRFHGIPPVYLRCRRLQERARQRMQGLPG
jgi:hypothetical protein